MKEYVKELIKNKEGFNVRVESMKESERVQRILFENGYQWPNGTTQLKPIYKTSISAWPDKDVTYGPGCYKKIPLEDLISPSLPFQVGDIVQAWGISGTVVHIFKDSTYPIEVALEGCGNEIFTKEGKDKTWHKEPSLILVERPIKKQPKKFWLWSKASGRIDDTLMDEEGTSPSGIKSPNFTSEYTKIPGTEVTIEVEVAHAN